ALAWKQKELAEIVDSEFVRGLIPLVGTVLSRIQVTRALASFVPDVVPVFLRCGVSAALLNKQEAVDTAAVKTIFFSGTPTLSVSIEELRKAINLPSDRLDLLNNNGSFLFRKWRLLGDLDLWQMKIK
ncbi:unnamed protein product, partial [Symbiodinium sp. KB8]